MIYLFWKLKAVRSAIVVSAVSCPDWRIVGPVWTPPELRNREYARRAVTGAVNILRDEGVGNIVLFAGNEAGINAYEAVGFRKVGDWRLDHLREPRDRI